MIVLMLLLFSYTNDTQRTVGIYYLELFAIDELFIFFFVCVCVTNRTYFSIFEVPV